MKRKPYMIKALISIEELNKIEEDIDNGIYNHPFMFSDFLDVDFTVCDDFEDCIFELDELTIIVFINQNSEDLITKISNKFNIKINVKQITEEIFNNEIKLSTFPKHLKNEIQEYIIEQYGQNDILDKILNKGVESITETDELILKQKTPKI